MQATGELVAGRELDALVAEKVMGDFTNPETVGYYGPPESGAWRHERSVRCDTESEAVEAWRRYYDNEIAAEPYGKAAREGDGAPHFDLCYWQEDWGPLLIEDYSTDIAAAWQVYMKVMDGSFSQRRRLYNALQEQTRMLGGRLVAWPDVLTVLRNRFPEAVCLAALKAVSLAE